MSSDLKRHHSDTLEDESTKRLRSTERGNEYPQPETEPNSTQQSVTEDCEHPSELTLEEYQKCLHFMRSQDVRFFDPGVFSEMLLRSVLTFIWNRKPGLCCHPDKADALLKRDPQLKRCLERRDFERALNSRIIFEVNQEAPEKPDTVWPGSLTPGMRQAVTAAWQQSYMNPGDMLESVLEQYIALDTVDSHYARYVSITQSSGTGKSRMVDELARKVLCIPMSLGSDNAYPPPDVKLRDWLKELEDYKWGESVQSLMCALFETVLARVKDIVSDSKSKGTSQSDLASKFRGLMSASMEYGRHGEYRRTFYADVCARATELSLTDSIKMSRRPGRPTPIMNSQDEAATNVEIAARALTSYLSELFPSREETSYPRIILCFDEAQLLTERVSTTGATLFSEVRRTLGLIRMLPIFAFFLSTVGKLEQFSPPPRLHSSARVVRLQLTPFEPIVWTPLDVLAQRLTKNKVWMLREVASTYHIVHLGRPLFPAMYDAAMAERDQAVNEWIFEFAGKKLLKKEKILSQMTPQEALACIAVRVPLDFNPVPLYPNEQNATAERTFVSDHLRLLLYADAGFSSIITTSASEPLLAEAACRLMVYFRWAHGKAKEPGSRKVLDPLVATKHHIKQSLLDLGSRGEFIAALLLLYARDCATTFALNDESPPGSSPDKGAHSNPKYDGAYRRRIVTVHQFLEALLGESKFKACADSFPRAYHKPEHATTPLRDAFGDAFIYFNHFIKVQSYDVVTQEYLLLAISRGAAIICADGHVGIDIIVPVLIGTVLEKQHVTAILVQARNSRHYKAKIQYPVFTNMNPYTCGLFDRNVVDPPPVLRMVLALASPEAAVAVPSIPTRQSARRDRTAKFTAYEIWCAGASHETFAVVQADEDKVVADLLKLIRDARDLSTQEHFSEPVQRVLRQMQPLASTHRDHIELFADPVDMGKDLLAEDAEEDAVVE